MECTPKALILEDEDLKFDLRRLLKSEGFGTKIANSVDQLVSLANEDHFDASIIDIRLTEKGTEGLDAIKQLRYTKPEMYLEVLTAYREFKEQALDMGADAVSFKPSGIDGLGNRIKSGILRKGLSCFADEMGLKMVPLSHIDIHDIGNQSTQAMLNVGFLAKCMPDVYSFLDSYAHTIGVQQEDIELIKKEIMNIMIKKLINGNIPEVQKMNKTISPQLSTDMNYLGYVRQRSKLKKEYPEMYVAFVNGRFVDANINLMDLHKQLEKEYAQKDVFIKKITRTEKTISLRRPRRILKG